MLENCGNKFQRGTVNHNMTYHAVICDDHRDIIRRSGIITVTVTPKDESFRISDDESFPTEAIVIYQKLTVSSEAVDFPYWSNYANDLHTYSLEPWK